MGLSVILSVKRQRFVWPRGGKTRLPDQILPPHELVQLGREAGLQADVERVGITIRRDEPTTGNVSEAPIDVTDQVVPE